MDLKKIHLTISDNNDHAVNSITSAMDLNTHIINTLHDKNQKHKNSITA